MSSFGNSERSRHTYGRLKNVTMKELASIRVGIKRKDVVCTSLPPGPIERGLDDPKSITLLVHSKKGNNYSKQKSIFEREGVQVNNERLVLIDANLYDQPQSENRSKSKSKSPVPSSSRRDGRSNSRGRSKGKSPERRGSPDRRRRDRRSIDRGRRSRDRDRSNGNGERRSRSPDRRYERRSNNREYERRRNSKEKDRDRGSSKERERSPRTAYNKSNYSHRPYSKEKDDYPERRKSITPLRPGEYRPNHPDLKRRSRSRSRDGYYRTKPRRSKSLSGDRQLHPIVRIRSLSPTRKSVSPRRSPKGRKTSKSPHRYERRSRSASPKQSKKSSQYDRYRRRSRSPRQTGASSPRGFRERRRYSRSPEYERYRRYRLETDRRKSRSRSPKHKQLVQYNDSTGMEFGFYEGMPGQEFWMSPGLIRPGYPVHRFYPPMFYPRGMPPGGPIMFPPRYPFPPIIKSKLPIYNNRPRPKVDPAPTSVNESSTVIGSSAKQSNSEGSCTVEELKSSSETRQEITEKVVVNEKE